MGYRRAVLGLCLLFLFVSPGESSPFFKRISPILECVEVKGDGWVIAHFGFENYGGIVSWIVLGLLNFFSGIDFDPPSSFPMPNTIPGRPGRTPFYPNAAFQVRFREGNTIVWHLLDRTATANKDSIRCPSLDIEPPQITCPANVVVNTASGSNTALVNLVATATDNMPGFSILNDFNDQQGAISAHFPIGTTAVTFSAQDSSDNTAMCTVTVTVRDVEAPVITCPSDLSITTGNAASATVTGFAATATDNSGSFVLSNTFDAAGGADASGAYPLGVTSVTWTATDPSNNVASCSATVTVTDDYPPTFTVCPAPLSVGTDAGKATSSQTLQAAAIDNAPGVVAITNSIDSDSGATLTHDFAVGTTTVTFTARDLVGNVAAPCTVDVTVTDVEAPVIANCPSNIDIFTDAGSPLGTLSGAAAVSASDNVGVTAFTASPASVVVTGSSADFNGAYPIGVTAVTISAADAAGLTASCTFTVTVTDNEAPVLTCPTPAAFPNSPGLADGIVDFSVSAADNSGAQPTITYSLDGGASVSEARFFGSLPIHTYSFVFTATDPSGNQAQCTVPITVADVEPPTFLSCHDLNLETNPGRDSAYVEQLTRGAQDNSGIQPVVVPADAGGRYYPFGSTRVAFTATDAAGNTANCTIRVIVGDSEPPVITVPSLEVRVTASGVLTDVRVEATVTDNVVPSDQIKVFWSWNNQPIKIGRIFQKALPVGTHTVRFTAIDRAQGNNAVPVTVTIIIEAALDAVLTAHPTIVDTCQNSFEISTASSSVPAGATVTLSLHETTGNSISADYIKGVLASNPTGTVFPFATGHVVVGEAEDVVDVGVYTFRLTITHNQRESTADVSVAVVAGDTSDTAYSVSLASSALGATINRDQAFEIQATVSLAGTCVPPLSSLALQWTVNPAFPLGQSATKARLQVPAYVLDLNSQYTFTFTVASAPGQPVLAQASGVVNTGTRRAPVITMTHYSNPPDGVKLLTTTQTIVTVTAASRDPDYPDWSRIQTRWRCTSQTLYGEETQCLFTSAEGAYSWGSGLFLSPPLPLAASAPALTFTGRDFRPDSIYSHEVEFWPVDAPSLKVIKMEHVLTEYLESCCASIEMYCDTETYGEDVYWNLWVMLSCEWWQAWQSSGFGTQASPEPVSHRWVEENGLVDLSGFTGSRLELDPEEFYVPGSTYRICRYTKFTEGKDAKGCYEFKTLNLAPVSSSSTPFVFAPATGEAFKTKFDLTLRGFSGLNRFKFAYKIGEGEEKPLTDLSTVNSVSVYLPAGDITLIGYVIGDASQPARVTTRLIVTAPANPTCALFSILDAALPSARKLGQEAVAVQLITYAAQLLQKVETPLVCDGLDRTADLEAIPSDLLDILGMVGGSEALNTAAAASLYSAALEAVTSAAPSVSTASSFGMIDNILAGMESGDLVQGERLSAAKSVFNTLSGMIGTGDCSVIAPAKERIARARGILMKGKTPLNAPVDVASENVELFVRRVSSSTSDLTVTLPGSDISVIVPRKALEASGEALADIAITRFSAEAVKGCRATKAQGSADGFGTSAVADTTVAGEVLSSAILDVDIVAPSSNTAVPVSNLAAPVIINLPVASGCASQASCAFWQSSQSSWISAGVSTEHTASGVVCRASHLTEFAAVGSPNCSAEESTMGAGIVALIAIVCTLALLGIGFFIVRRTPVKSWVSSRLATKDIPVVPSEATPSSEVAASTA